MMFDNRDVICANADFVLREIAGETILVPTGDAAADFNGLASLNGSGRFLWNVVQAPVCFGDLLLRFREEYELDEEEALQDLTEFLVEAGNRKVILIDHAVSEEERV